MKLFDTVDFKNKITTYEEFKMSFSGADVVDRFKDKIRENADRAAKETIPMTKSSAVAVRKTLCAFLYSPTAMRSDTILDIATGIPAVESTNSALYME